MPRLTIPEATTYQDGRHFDCYMLYKDQPKVGFNLIVDERGKIVSRNGVDFYNRLDPKPTPSADDIHLGPLPKILKHKPPASAKPARKQPPPKPEA